MMDIMAGRSSHKTNSPAIRLVLPSRFGYEKIAMEAAACLAEIMGFSSARVEDLRTAVSEACINAMEHGNNLNAHSRVELLLIPGRRTLKVQVHDRGKGFEAAMRTEPNIAKKLAGEESPRGWGLYLIERLVDHVEFKTIENVGHVTTLTMKLGK
jgi:serine/threonine-protein kinase RsbW